MENYAIWIITSILVGFVAAFVAKSKGKDPVLWFFLGALFNLFVLLFALGVKKRKEHKESAL
jgi:uncharacterized membrane protein YhaH (DUF805 family)